ncbi:hypothetical protein M0813_28210 [Anaeramoeba flamelloides]|uniref:Uncharacterized protein n=1 Tax=Anaeramoeba flamelloides TaxID=1746091 RepID=A0ABQ8XTQ2_9EUKA|nr:hypothetical protein M0813_28210 [Anaeramoeba flamelloides]
MMSSQFTDQNTKLQLCLALLDLGSQRYLGKQKIGKSMQSHKQEEKHKQYSSNFENLYFLANLHLKPRKTATRRGEKVNQIQAKIGNLQEKKKNQISKKQQDEPSITEKQLSDFLNRKPKPSWGERIEFFYMYNPRYIIGWQKGLATSLAKRRDYLKPSKIIVNKKILVKVAKLACTTNTKKEFLKFYKSTSRGIEEFLKRLSYIRQTRYERKKLVFVLTKK